jgi:hypothetical protein
MCEWGGNVSIIEATGGISNLLVTLVGEPLE